MHAMFKEFVSMDVDDYILILDATQLHKYTMPLDDSFTSIFRFTKSKLFLLFMRDGVWENNLDFLLPKKYLNKLMILAGNLI